MTVVPRCPVFGTCGGCASQDVEYEKQLQAKKDGIIDCFKKKGIEISPAVNVFSKDEYFYRNRMDFPFSKDGPGQRMKARFDKLVHFERCYLSNNGINIVFDEVQAWFDANRDKLDIFDVVERQGTLRYATIRAGYYSGESSVTFILNSNSGRIDEQKALIEAFAAGSKVKNVLLGLVKYNTDRSAVPDAVVIKGSAVISEKLGPFNFNFHTQGFFQSNSAVFMDILFFIRERIKLPYDVLIDLYGGAGTIGIALSDAAREVYIVDNNNLNTVCAEKNIRTNRVENVKVFDADAEKTAELGINAGGKRTILVLDPPRNGIHRKVHTYINNIKPEKIFYVSCNYKSQADDLKLLLKTYDLKDFGIFDMFPQTGHVETVAELEIIK